MNRFEGLIEFMAVIETGSFSSAARKLGASVAHVSRHVAGLETRLGTKLFARTTRRVRPTAAGEQLASRSLPLLEELERIQDGVLAATESLEGSIRFSMAGAFVVRQVLPQLANFCAAHPRVRIEVDLSGQKVDLLDGWFDFALRMAPLENSNALVARRFAEMPMVTVASAGPDRTAGKRGRYPALAADASGKPLPVVRRPAMAVLPQRAGGRNRTRRPSLQQQRRDPDPGGTAGAGRDPRPGLRLARNRLDAPPGTDLQGMAQRGFGGAQHRVCAQPLHAFARPATDQLFVVPYLFRRRWRRPIAADESAPEMSRPVAQAEITAPGKGLTGRRDGGQIVCAAAATLIRPRSPFVTARPCPRHAAKKNPAGLYRAGLNPSLGGRRRHGYASAADRVAVRLAPRRQAVGGSGARRGGGDVGQGQAVGRPAPATAGASGPLPARSFSGRRSRGRRRSAGCKRSA